MYVGGGGGKLRRTGVDSLVNRTDIKGLPLVPHRRFLQHFGDVGGAAQRPGHARRVRGHRGGARLRDGRAVSPVALSLLVALLATALALPPALAVAWVLEREGLARDLVRLVQQERKDGGLDVSDRIDLVVGVGEGERHDELVEALRTHGGYVAEQTLAESLELGEPSAD